MRKIIYKSKIDSRDEFEAKLSSLDYDFGPVYWQHNRVFIPKNYQNHSNYPRMILRIEMKAVDRPAKYELICKRHIEDSGVTISHATQVKDYSEAASILLQLGFVMQAEISRRRQALEIDKNTMVYIDQIDNQEENFVKIEITLEDDKKVGEAQRKLESLLAEFGLTGNIRLKETYAELV
jgi:CYTH domain